MCQCKWHHPPPCGRRRKPVQCQLSVNSVSTQYQVVSFCQCCPSWQSWWHWHRTGYRWSPVRTLPVAPLWCDLGRCSQTVVVIKLRRTSAFWLSSQSVKKSPFRVTLQEKWHFGCLWLRSRIRAHHKALWGRTALGPASVQLALCPVSILKL